MRPFLLLVFLFTSPLIAGYSHCPSIDQCECDTDSSEIVCDGNYGNQSANDFFPEIGALPSVESYVFRNFKQLRASDFDNVTFLSNRSISISLVNISVIGAHAFSNKTIIPHDSTLSIDIEHFAIVLRANAFHHVKVHRLRFLKVSTFNYLPTFNVDSFGEGLHINELIFEQSGLTGFSNTTRRTISVQSLSIRECPFFTQLSNRDLPAFLSTTKSLEISSSGLRSIQSHTFSGWSLFLREFILRNNTELRYLPPHMVDGFLMQLETLDLSDNAISALDVNYDWFAYSYAENLLLERQPLDLFLKSHLFKSLGRLRTVALSGAFLSNWSNSETLIRDYVPEMPNLVSIDVSHTNLSENMIIDLLSVLSRSANRTMRVRLLGRVLNDNHFCSYFTIFQKAPNLLHLELDDDHQCNCVVDLFYDDEHLQGPTNPSERQPRCLSNTTRLRCDIQKQLKLSQCSVGKPNPDGSGSDTGLIGNYAFIGVMAGLGTVVLLLLGIGSGALYRARKTRRFTDVDMEEPVEDAPAATTNEESSQTAAWFLVSLRDPLFFFCLPICNFSEFVSLNLYELFDRWKAIHSHWKRSQIPAMKQDKRERKVFRLMRVSSFLPERWRWVIERWLAKKRTHWMRGCVMRVIFLRVAESNRRKTQRTNLIRIDQTHFSIGKHLSWLGLVWCLRNSPSFREGSSV